MTKLKISPDLALPEESVTEAFAILAKRGVGKTYTGSVMVEEMLKAKLQVAVIDPLGVWYGLRSSADGKAPGFPILIFGGQHGDVPLEPGEASGKLIADLVVEERLSAVLDLSLFSKEEMRTLVTAFAERLFRTKATRPDPLHLMVDEADMFLPQRYPAGPTARMIGAFNDLVLKGRVRGLGSTLITQRSAKVDKDVLTQVEILLTMRITHPAAAARLQELHGEAYRRRAGQILLLPGARELLAFLTELGVPWAIATSGYLESAGATIGLLGVPDGVPIITRDQVVRAKPDPDLFLAAAERLNVDITESVVVGDSVWDLLASRRARALGVGLLSGGYGQEELERAGAYRVYEDPADLLRHLDEVGVRTPPW